jgi:hypothetical protein
MEEDEIEAEEWSGLKCGAEDDDTGERSADPWRDLLEASTHRVRLPRDGSR